MSFARALPELSLYILDICCVIIILIDRAFNELSNGGQFVNFDHWKLEPICFEIIYRTAKPELELSITF